MEIENKYILRRMCKSTDELYTRALQIYTAETPQEIYTNTNEISHWLDRGTDDCAFDMYIFTLVLNGDVIGFAQATYLKNTHIAILDYISLKNSHRLNSVFLIFLSMIRNYFEIMNVRVTFYVAEISNKDNGEHIDRESAFYKQIMCLENFGVVKAKYYNFPLGISNHECDFQSLLYIKTNELIKSISRDTFLEIVISICNDYYIKWYSEFLYGDDLTNYKKKITAKLNSIKEATTNDKIDVQYTQCSVKGGILSTCTDGAVPVYKPKKTVKLLIMGISILIIPIIVAGLYNFIFPKFNIPFTSISSFIGATISASVSACLAFYFGRKN